MSLNHPPLSQRLMQQIAFIQEIEKLKTIHRQNLTLDAARQENSAEHSWHLAVMAILLAEYMDVPALDMTKVLKLLLVHDLGEIEAGDTSIYDETARAGARHREEAGLIKTLSLLPEDQAAEIMSLWQEFEDRFTPEARYAASLDGLQPLINHFVTAPDGTPPYLNKEKVLEKKSYIRDCTPGLWPAVLKMIELNEQRGLIE